MLTHIFVDPSREQVASIWPNSGCAQDIPHMIPCTRQDAMKLWTDNTRKVIINEAIQHFIPRIIIRRIGFPVLIVSCLLRAAIGPRRRSSLQWKTYFLPIHSSSRPREAR